MKHEYAYVGPALMELSLGTAEFVREEYGRKLSEPLCLWLAVNHTWINVDGQRISGWRHGQYFAFRPNWLNRWKIRCATKSYARALATPNATGKRGAGQ